MSDAVPTKTALHHILPQQFYKDVPGSGKNPIGAAYEALGFQKESMGNHINVIVKEDVRTILLDEIARVVQADPSIPDGVIRASTVHGITGGYSPSNHSSGHTGYSAFFEETASGIIDGVAPSDLTPGQQQQLSDLHAFMRDVAAGSGFVSTDPETGVRTVKFSGVQSATKADLDQFFQQWNADRLANPTKYADVGTYRQTFDQDTQKTVGYIDKNGVTQTETLDATPPQDQPTCHEVATDQRRRRTLG